MAHCTSADPSRSILHFIFKTSQQLTSGGFFHTLHLSGHLINDPYVASFVCCCHLRFSLAIMNVFIVIPRVFIPSRMPLLLQLFHSN